VVDPKPIAHRSEAVVIGAAAVVLHGLQAVAPGRKAIAHRSEAVVLIGVPPIVEAPIEAVAVVPPGLQAAAPDRKPIERLHSAHHGPAAPSDRQTGRVRAIGFLLVVRAVDPQAEEQVTVLALVRRPVQDQAVGPVIGRPSVAVPDRVLGPTSGAGLPNFPPIAPAQATGRPAPASFLAIVPVGAIGWVNDLLLVTVQAPAAVIAFPRYRLRVPIWAAGEEWAEAALRRLEPGLPAVRSAQVLPTGWVTDKQHCPGWVTGVVDLVSYRRTVHFRTGVKVFKTG
jgi:hypothetical protein